ncbi:MAG: hypothetical protein IT318_20290 [Anaerolineales bacterium]|nr:hypothetical protein [Anaerolineales bacterium]
MAVLQLGGGQQEQVPPQVMEAARTVLRQFGAPEEMPLLAAFLRSAKDPAYAQQVPQLAQTGKLPPQLAAAVRTYFGGGMAAPESGLALPQLPGLGMGMGMGMGMPPGAGSGAGGFIGPNPMMALMRGR